MQAQQQVRVLGIDPGLTRLGYAVLEERTGDLHVLDCGTIRTSSSLAVPSRLSLVADAVAGLLGRWLPPAVAVERVYLKLNARSAIPSIQAAGVAMAAAASAGAEVVEFSPAEVKRAVVGSGSATKDQVAFMVDRLITGGALADSPDASDALAIAICYLNSRRMRRLSQVTA